MGKIADEEIKNTIVDVFYILYGSYGFGNNHIAITDLENDAITTATNNITLNWEKIYSALPEIRTISRMLGWDSDRVQFLEDVISLLEIN